MTPEEILRELRERAAIAATAPPMPSDLTEEEQQTWLKELIQNRRTEMGITETELLATSR